MKWVSVLVLMLLCSSLVYAQTCESVGGGSCYYVSVDGSDSNDGLSPDTAFATITRADQVIESQGSGGAGSVIYVLPGVYSEDSGPWNAVQLRADGLPGYPITLTSYDSNNPAVIEGPGVALHLDYANYRVVQNLIVRNASSGIHGGYSYSVIQNNTVYNIRGPGNSNPLGIGYVGYNSVGWNNTIRFNHVFDVDYDGSGPRHNAMCIVMFKGNAPKVYNNYVHDCGTGIRQKHHQTNVSDGAPDPFAGWIYHNRAEDLYSWSMGVGGSELDIYENLFVNGGGISISGDAADQNDGFNNNRIQRNSFVNTGGISSWQGYPGDSNRNYDGVFRDNVWELSSGTSIYDFPTDESIAISDNNCFSHEQFDVNGSMRDLSGLQSLGYDANSMITGDQTNPSADYQLTSTSPCRNAGSSGQHIGAWTGDNPSYVIGIPHDLCGNGLDDDLDGIVDEDCSEPETGICEATGDGTCYYIDPENGDDGADGSFSNPWRTFSKIISYYTSSYRPGGWIQLGPGDVVYLRGGLHNTTLTPGDGSGPEGGQEAIAYFRDRGSTSGTSSNPITIKGYPGENAVVGDTLNHSDSGVGIYLLASDWWNIHDIEFRYTPGNCVLILGSSDIKLYNLEIHNCGRKVSGGNPNGLTLSGEGTNAEVYNSTFYDNFWDPNLNGGTWNFPRGAGIQMFDGYNHSIHDNLFYQTKQILDPDGNPSGYGNCIFQKHAQDDVNSYLHVYNNTFINCENGWAFGSGTQNTYFHHNLVIDSSVGVRVADFGGTTYQVNQLYEYNTFVNTKPFVMSPSLTPYDGLFSTLPQNITFRNNVAVYDLASYNTQSNFLDVGTYSDDEAYYATVPELSFESNCYYNPSNSLRFGLFAANNDSSNTRPQYGVMGGTYNLSEWRSFGYDLNSLSTDPLFNDPSNGDYALQEGSLCEGLGYGGIGSLPEASISTGPGDLDGDGDVDIDDVLIVARDLGRSSGFDSISDGNGDGVVNVFDLVLVAKYFGSVY